MQFTLQLSPTAGSSLCTALPAANPDLSAVPKDYHKFADVFSKAKALVLAPYQDHDLKIDLEEGATLLPGRLYSLSPIKLEALWTFIDKNLRFGFIHPTSSSHAASVLFIKKKDGSL